MRLIRFWIALIVTVGLIVLLDIQLPVGGSKTPRLGQFLSPQKGFWQNAEPVDFNIDELIKSNELEAPVEVYFNKRLVPHVYAENLHDAFFVQGYLHAKFRLWQMEFQTHAAAGRLSEILGAESAGTKFIDIDVFFRRLGMVYAAEKSVKAVEEDAATKSSMDAYTAGVNAYIKSLRPEHYPLEYKLLNYAPEPWTNLKTCLFLKYMSFDLAGFEEDFEMTAALRHFSSQQFNQLYPYGSDSLDPIFPGKNIIAAAALQLRIPQGVDTGYFKFNNAKIFNDTIIKPDPDNGSNNWAVDGSKTASGKPILCNDPHLGLNLPSLWFEMQISTPEFNAYGASFPGAPAVIIGFNDSSAWGFTNAMRDVRDYYRITFRDSTKQHYLYNDHWFKTSFRNEVIKVRGGQDTTIKLPMTLWGPVMYENRKVDEQDAGYDYACRWKAHDAGIELKTFIELNKANNTDDYLKAIAGFKTPGQNMLFASKSGDIALKQQGEFPGKWYRQGDFLMSGDNDDYAWQGNIPQQDNFVMKNPERGFVSSANQLPYDVSYPYYLGGSYPPFRGFLINRYLNGMNNITANDMMLLQNNNHNLLAEWARPKLLTYIDETGLTTEQKSYLDIFKSWNLLNHESEKGATVFHCWWDSLSNAVYADEINHQHFPWPHASTLLDNLLKDSVYDFTDNIHTADIEGWTEVITSSFIKACEAFKKLDQENRMAWGIFKDSGVRHLLKIGSLSRLHLNAGGGNNIINAYKQFHGPSWKMVVHLTDETEAYGIYPGGQSGNPGSKYYDDFIDDFVAGHFYKIRIIKKSEWPANAKGKMIFKPAS